MKHPSPDLPILGNCRLLGVIGDPIQHSLSPVMHNAAIEFYAKEQGLRAMPFVYMPFNIAADRLSTAIAGLESIHCQGFNITIPHKQAIMGTLDQISDVAQRIGAVNTVWRSETGWEGTNTDVFGFLAPLISLERNWSGSEALILGNGGAARAVIAGCEQLGFETIRMIGRDRAKLAAIQNHFQDLAHPNRIQIHTWDEIHQFLGQAQLVVNTTPVGMAPNVDASPLDERAIATLPSTAVVYDLIYTPQPTKFLAIAAHQDKLAIDGLEMLVQQGAKGLEIWLGAKPNVDVMRRAAQNSLGLKVA
jgi:shikimate dehydrogenase